MSVYLQFRRFGKLAVQIGFILAACLFLIAFLKGREPIRELEKTTPLQYAVRGKVEWTNDGLVEISGKTVTRFKTGKVVFGMEDVITVFTADSGGTLIGVADGRGRVAVISDLSTRVARQPVNGYVLDVVPLSSSEMLVCWGSSGYSPDFHVTRFAIGESLVELGQVDTGFACALFSGDTRGAVYATEDAYLGYVSADLKHHVRVRWEDEITTLQIAPSGLILVGDRSGKLSLLDRDLTELQQIKLSKGVILSAVFTEDNRFFVLDSNRYLYLGKIDGHDMSVDRIRALSSYHAVDIVRDKENGLTVISQNSSVFRVPGQLIRDIAEVEARHLFLVIGFLASLAAMVLSFFKPKTRILDRLKSSIVEWWRMKNALLMLVPSLLLVCLFIYYPVLSAVGYAFTEFSLTSPAKFVGVENFHDMMKDPYVRTGMLNMLLFIMTGILKIVTVPLLIAELVYWTSSRRLQQIYRTMFVIPGIIPGMVIILLWKMIYEPEYGLINQALGFLGLEQFQHAWLGNESTALWAIIFHGFPWVNMLAFLVFLGALVRIDRNLFESAWIDGAGTIKRFRHIDLPFIMPQVKLLITLVMINSIQDVTAVLLFTGGGPGIATYTPALQMFYATTEEGNLGYGSAIGVLLFAIVLFATFVLNKVMRERPE
jgi:ABC-type sugar transport system permease subunit